MATDWETWPGVEPVPYDPDVDSGDDTELIDIAVYALLCGDTETADLAMLLSLPPA